MTKQVILCGAGVIGTTTAYLLARSGYDVHLLEQEREVGMGATQGNGCQMASMGIRVLNDQDFLWQSLRSLIKETGGVFWRPEWQRSHGNFLWKSFWTKQKTREDRAYKIALLALLSLQRCERMAIEEPSLDLHHASLGILSLFTHPRGKERWRGYQTQITRAGGTVECLTSKECFEKIPALRESPIPIYGGVLGLHDRIADAHLFTRQILQKAEHHGVKIHRHAPVKTLQTDGVSIKAMVLENGTIITGDLFILCAGWQTVALAASLGEWLPITNVRGYSITVPRGDLPISMGIIDHHHRIVFSPVGAYLRMAGFHDYGALSSARLWQRKGLFQQLLFHYFPSLKSTQEHKKHNIWTGIRPVSHDGLPIIGTSKKWKNLFYNTGHGGMGWLLAPGSAQLLADIVMKNPPLLPERMFSPRH